jgi:hypothetical protein
MSPYLSQTDAVNAVNTAEGMICELLLASGVSSADLPARLHAWTGKVPLT